jgi:hypothetical protein
MSSRDMGNGKTEGRAAAEMIKYYRHAKEMTSEIDRTSKNGFRCYAGYCGRAGLWCIQSVTMP